MTRASRSSSRWQRLAWAGLLLVAAPAEAQQKPPDLTAIRIEDLMKFEIEPVFGASRRLQPVTEAPASVTIITAEDITRFGYRTIADILQGVRGFYVTDDRNCSCWVALRYSAPAVMVCLLTGVSRMTTMTSMTTLMGEPVWKTRGR